MPKKKLTSSEKRTLAQLRKGKIALRLDQEHSAKLAFIARYFAGHVEGKTTTYKDAANVAIAAMYETVRRQMEAEAQKPAENTEFVAEEASTDE